MQEGRNLTEPANLTELKRQRQFWGAGDGGKIFNIYRAG